MMLTRNRAMQIAEHCDAWTLLSHMSVQSQ